MPDIRITADLHLGHQLVSGLRGFTTPREHDDAILANLAEGATDDTIWWILGDVAFGDRLAGLERLRAEVPGHKRLVMGNHEPIHPAWRRNVDWTPWTQTFEQIHLHASIEIEGRRYLLSHFPYDGDHLGEERFEQWRLKDMGVILLHGHTHSSERLSYSESGTPQIHVGLDAWDLCAIRPEALSTLPRSGSRASVEKY